MKEKLLSTLLFVVSIVFTQSIEARELKQPNSHYTTFAKKFENRQFSREEFKHALSIAGLPAKHIDQIFIHAQRESGNFKSKVFRENNNAFGMRLPRRRTTTAIGKNRGYAVYTNWYDSIYDYWLWYDNKPIKSEQSWGAYLRSRNYMNPKDKKK